MQIILQCYKTFLRRKYFRKQLVTYAEGKHEEKSVSKQNEVWGQSQCFSLKIAKFSESDSISMTSFNYQKVSRR